MPRTLTLILLALFTLSAPAEDPTLPKPAPKPAPKPWLDMDYGPVLATTVESAYPTRNITQKGLLIRLDEKTKTYVCFDEDLCRYSLAWTGGAGGDGPIDWNGVLYNGVHRVWPKAVGQPIFGASLTPGWAHAGSFDDPRPRFPSTDYTKESKDWQNRPYGTLPRDHAQYKGLYLHGQRVILSYTVNGTPILDSPGLEPGGALTVITRTLNIARSDTDLDLQILEHPTTFAEVISGSRSNPPLLKATAVRSVAVIGSLVPQRDRPAAVTRPARDEDDAIAVLAKGVSPDMTFNITGQSRLSLHIPATATPARIKLFATRVNAATYAVFTAIVPLKSADPEDLSPLTRGGPPRYPQTFTTQGQLARSTDAPYVADTITPPNDNPFKSRLRFGAFDFYPDGKSAALSTWDGDVWRVDNIDDKLDHLTWRRIATGLHQPLGLKILPKKQAGAERREPRDQSAAPDPSDSQIYVLCRDQLARLHGLNNDGEIDFIECVNNDAIVTEHFHEFAMGLQTDEQGNFYYAKSARHALDAVTPHHGTLLKISADGQHTTVLATGFRAANGIAIGPHNEIAATDQEGFWTPANRINLLLTTNNQQRTTPFFGNIWSYTTPKRKPEDGYDPPLCWIPPTVDRSPAEDLWVTSDKWGPLKGRMIHTSYGTGKLFLVPYEIIDGVPQGGVIPFPDLKFPTGIMRARFNPLDGQLYTCGLFGWAGNATQPGGFYRIRYTGQPVHLPVELYASKDTLTLTFTNPLDKATAEDPANYALQQWSYRWTQNYGSKAYSIADPKKEARDDVEITSATLSRDNKTITLTIPNLKPVMQMKIQLNLKSADGLPIKHAIHNTINRLP